MSTPLFSDKVAEIFVKVDDFCNHFEDEFKEINARLTHVEEYLQETTKSEKSEEEVKDDFVKIVIKK